MLRRALRGLRRLLSYAPRRDGRPDPGEVVWAWVPYEDRLDGKDRPVLVIGHEGGKLLALSLTSNPRRDGQPGWHALGTGGWDRRGRPSWVNVGRVIRLNPWEVRREGAALDRRRFDRVLAALDDR